MGDPGHLLQPLERLAGAAVLCVGDVMLDHYVYGEVDRVSPEAPIPVLRVVRETRTLGGAGNVLRNLVALGGAPVFLTVIGDDATGREVTALLADSGSHAIVEAGRTTTLKTRYVAGTQQLLRADREGVRPLADETRARLVAAVEAALPSHRVLVLSDYAKGVLDGGVAEALIAAARKHGVPVIVDPKGRDYARYRGAALLKPNRRELGDAAAVPVADMAGVVDAARRLIERCALGAVLVSLSQDGMVLVEAGGGVASLAAEAREVFDVSGAGDTVIATVAAALAGGLDLATAARLANVAAGIVVGKVGTAVAHAPEIAAVLAGSRAGASAKVLPASLAADHVARWRRAGLRVGFTNGCFDLVHPGHVFLLEQARAACDRLVVGLNSDASVKRLKGAGRPVQSEPARAAVLASIAAVDLVVVFDEDTPMALIEAIRPDVLVKGRDYRIDEVVGASFVQSYGGKVLLAELQPGHSTTATIARMR